MLLSFEEFAAFTPQRETYALFGYPLGHTMSPALHAALFAATGRDADYIAVTVPPEKLAEARARAGEARRHQPDHPAQEGGHPAARRGRPKRGRPALGQHGRLPGL